MKKFVSLFAVAAFLFAACGNSTPAEPTVDETTEPIIEVVDEPTVDETTSEVEVTEEAATEATA